VKRVTTVVITVDTESDNLWDPALVRHPEFRNIVALPRLQGVFDTFGATPTYLVTFGVARNAAVGALKDIHAAGRCEIGAHLHPLETPPWVGPAAGDGSYLHHYARPIQQQKLARLDETLGHVFGQKASSYRGGRYSFDGHTPALLGDQGYRVDTSVTPGISWEADGGPNFKHHPHRHYFLGAGEYPLLEVPVSIKVRTRLPALSKALYLTMPPWTHTEGILRRLTRLNIVWLDPSFNTDEDMRWLCDALLAEGVAGINVMFHSSVIVQGGTPYTMTAEETERFFGRLERLLDYLLRVQGLKTQTLSQFYETRRQEARAGCLP
jgi:hypothetical protein